MPITNKSYITFEQFLDSSSVWLSKEAANEWFDKIHVNMAGICNPGTVRKSEAVAYAPNTITGDYYSMNMVDPVEGVINMQFASKIRYDLLEAKVLAIETAYQALVKNLIAAGHMSNDTNETCS